jgi:hypothetical protein
MKKYYYFTSILCSIVCICFLLWGNHVLLGQTSHSDQHNPAKPADKTAKPAGSENPNPKPNKQEPKEKKAAPTDLILEGIYGGDCPCHFTNVDAFYMKYIEVRITNNYQGKGGASTDGVIRIKYYDLVDGAEKIIKRQMPRLNPYPQKSWEYKAIILNHPVLTKKSSGLTVEVLPGSDEIKDPVLENNSKTIHQCEKYLPKDNDYQQ